MRLYPPTALVRAGCDFKVGYNYCRLKVDNRSGTASCGKYSAMADLLGIDVVLEVMRSAGVGVCKQCM